MVVKGIVKDKIADIMLEQLKKEKSLSKLTPNSFDKHLNMIYNITHNNQNKDIIKSVHLNIK